MGKPLKAVLFDFDGTLTRPGSLDFGAVRQAIGSPAGLPILEHIETLAPGEPRDQAVRILERFELEAAERSLPNTGAEDLIAFLKTQQLKLGILTRNSLNSVSVALQNFQHIRESDFDAIITRHDVAQPKPYPDGVLLAAARMKVSPDQLLVVGDYVFDIEAGQRAGAQTAFLVHETTTRFPDPPADFTLKILEKLKSVIRSLM